MDSINQLLSGLLGSGGSGQALFAILVAYAGGALSSLTPCVYPMIPITVSVVGGTPISGKRGSDKSWGPLLLRSLAYVAGMTLIYSFLGVAAGLTGRVFGTFTNTPT